VGHQFRSGLVVDLSTGMSYDPQTGQPADTQSVGPSVSTTNSNWILNSDGLIVDLSTGASYDPQTGLPVATSTSVPAPSLAGLDISKDDGTIYFEDPDGDLDLVNLSDTPRPSQSQSPSFQRPPPQHRSARAQPHRPPWEIYSRSQGRRQPRHNRQFQRTRQPRHRGQVQPTGQSQYGGRRAPPRAMRQFSPHKGMWRGKPWNPSFNGPAK